MCWSHFHIFFIHFTFYCFFLSSYVLNHLCKQLGISVVKLAPPSIQVVQQSSLDLANDVLVKTRRTEKEGEEKASVSLDESDRCQKLENKQKDSTVTAEDGCDKKREVVEEKKSTEVRSRELGGEGSRMKSSLEEVVRLSYPSESLEELVRCPTPNPLPNPRVMGGMSATPKKRPRTSNFIDAVSKEKRQYRGSKIAEERDSEELRIEQVHIQYTVYSIYI